MWVTPPARIILPVAYDLAGRGNATEADAPAPGKATELTRSSHMRHSRCAGPCDDRTLPRQAARPTLAACRGIDIEQQLSNAMDSSPHLTGSPPNPEETTATHPYPKGSFKSIRPIEGLHRKKVASSPCP
jgi:hypothetical protein